MMVCGEVWGILVFGLWYEWRGGGMKGIGECFFVFGIMYK